MNGYNNNVKKQPLCARVVVIGDAGIGKTTLIRKFVNGSGNSSKSHNNKYCVMDIVDKTWDLTDGRKIKMAILDTGGLERYRSLTRSHYRGIHGCLVVFNVNNYSSFDSVTTWIKDLQTFTADYDKISVLLVGISQESHARSISQEQASKLAEYLGIPYVEVSLCERHTNNAFEQLADMIIERYEKKTSIASSTTTKIDQPNCKESWCSC